jgi:ABC-2 type transport system ATP-binding protein
MNATTLIQAQHLSYRYDQTQALEDISFSLQQGEVLGLLGVNGAGKSTTMQILSGNLAFHGGELTINGIDARRQPLQARAHLGFLPEIPPLYPQLSVDEYLHYAARLHQIPAAQCPQAITHAKEKCGLAQHGRQLIGQLSKGYQQRIGIAQAIIHQPAIIMLDEPTVGLDPNQIREIRALICELGQDHGILISSHILPEIESTCSRVIIMHQGTIVFSNTMERLHQQQASSTTLVAFSNPPPASALKALGISEIEPLGNRQFRLHHTAAGLDIHSLTRQAVEQQWHLLQLTPEHTSLEQIFVELTCSDIPTATSTREAAER